MSISAYRTFFADGFTHIGHIRIILFSDLPI